MILAEKGYWSYSIAIGMRILGIETSCDETAVSLIEGSGVFGADFSFKTLGSALISQAKMHTEYGGVYPNLAKREHAKNLVPVLETALREAGELTDGSIKMLEDIEAMLHREAELFTQLAAFASKHARPNVDAIAITHGPGLEPALWVGVNFAKALSRLWDVPLVAVNHMEGHIVLSMMEENILKEFDFPALVLLISGGHTEIVLSKAFGSYEILGETRDDAVGEAFDKVARLLGLPYPGGPEISRLAEDARARHLQFAESFTRPMMNGYDFSFSGLKTGVRRIVESRPEMTTDEKAALAREFEDTVSDVLISKTLRAVEEFGVNAVVVGGGVSANTHIRAELARKLAEFGGSVQLLIPPPALATDNALMIALAGYFHALKKEFVNSANLSAQGNLRLGE